MQNLLNKKKSEDDNQRLLITERIEILEANLEEPERKLEIFGEKDLALSCDLFQAKSI